MDNNRTDANTYDLAEEVARHWIVVDRPVPGDSVTFQLSPEHLAEYGIFVRGPVTVRLTYHLRGEVISGESLAGVLGYASP